MATTEETIRLTIEAKGAQEAVQLLRAIGTSGEAATKQVSDGFVKLAASSEAGQARMQMMNAELKLSKGAATSFTEALKYMNAEQTLAFQKIWQTTDAAKALTTATNQGAQAQRSHAASVSATTSSYSNLSKALQIAIGYLSFREILKTVDAYNTLQTKLALVSGEQDNTSRSVAKFINVAQAAATQSKGIFGNIIDATQEANGAVEGVHKNILKVTDAIGDLGEKTKDLGNGFGEVTAKAGKFGEVKVPSFSEAAKGAKEYVQSLDGVTVMESRLATLQETEEAAAKLAAAAAERKNVAYNALKQTAILTGQDINVVADSFVRLTNATTSSGYSQQQMLKVTDLVAKSLYTQKVSGQAAETALTQLGQAFSSGRLRGQDWNSVIQQAPGLIQVLANAITNGSIPALHKMALENQLTTDKMVSGFIAQEAAINNLVAKTKPTISGAFQSLKTALEDYIGKADEASGMSAKLAEGILYVGQNLNTVIPIVAAFAGVWATVKVIGIIAELGGFLFSLPGLLTVAAVGVVYLLDKFGLLGPTIEILKQVWEEFSQRFVSGLQVWKGWITSTFDYFAASWTSVTTTSSNAWSSIKQSASDFLSWIENSWVGRLVSAISGAFQTVADLAKSAFQLMSGNANGTTVGSIFQGGGNGTEAAPYQVPGTWLGNNRNGGSYSIPGAGPTDSRLVQFMATPGEVISVHTPAQAYGQAPLPRFRDGGTLGLGGGGAGVNLGLQGVDVQYLASANTSVTGYNMGDALGGAIGPTSIPNYPSIPNVGANDNSPDLATQIADALSIASTSPLTYGRSVSAAGYMRGSPTDTNFIDSVIASTLKKGIDVSMFYAGLSAGDIRKGPLYYQAAGSTQSDYDKFQIEYQTDLNDYNPFAAYPGGQSGADIKRLQLLDAGAIPWNDYKLGLEASANHNFMRQIGMKSILHARDGMDYTVPGGGAVDSRLLALAVSPGEHVSVKTPGQKNDGTTGGGGQTIVVHQTIMANTLDDVRRSSAQIEQETSLRMSRAARRAVGAR
jgi:tape measure domain-containing protein